MRHRTVLIGWGVCLFFLLSNFCLAQFPVQDTADHGAMDTVYINCTPPDFFEKDSIRVNFDLMFWTDATLPREVIIGWNAAFHITSSNPAASARVVLDASPMGPVYKGTAVGFPNDWEARFNISDPRSGVLPATVIYGAIMMLESAGPPLSAGTLILAHIIIIVKDTTTIYIDTTSTETVSLQWVRNDAVAYTPFWVQSYCPVTPVVCLHKPGDANGNGKVDLTDLIFMVNNIMKGGPAPVFECQVDLNADRIVTMLDIVFGVDYIFKGGIPPVKSWVCCL